MFPTKQPSCSNQFQNRSDTLCSRRSRDIDEELRRTVTVNSVPLSVGDFMCRKEVEREWDIKRHWLETKRMEEARRVEYIVQLQSRIHREAEARRAREDRIEDPYLVNWEEADPEDPQQLTFRKKIWITAVCCILTVNVTFASSAPSTAVIHIAASLDVSRETALLITSIFLCGYVVGPIIWAPASELVGRRPVFIGTILAYTLCTLGQAIGRNIATVLVTRFFAGLFASAPLTNCGGVISDIWGPVHRGTATALFSGSVFIGPVMGPIVGGFVVQSYLGWRWIFWVMTIFAGFCWILVLFFLPETYGPILLTRRARGLRKQDPEKYGNKYAALERADHSPKAILERTVFRPFTMLLMEPILVLITIYLSVIYGLLYALFSVFPIIWQELRGFNEGEDGLIFVGVGVGTTIGAAFSIWTQRHYRLLVPKWHGSPPPEERLPGAMYAGPCLIIGIFWLGWTGAFVSIPWWVPALATIPIGMSFTLIFISYLSYIVDTYLLFAASALAANTIFRSAVGAGFPLFTNQMFNALTIQGACSLIGGISIILLPIPFVFYKYGPKIRERSKFAPCVDIKIRDQVEEEERRAKGIIKVEGQEPAHEDSTGIAV